MKKLITLLEISSSDFRTKLKSVGFSEKGNQLTSGGELNPEFLNILSSLIDEWKKSNPSCALTFTSGNDTYHKTRKSLHTVGLAVDITLDGGCKSSFLRLLDSYKTKYNGFSYIDEYSHPSPGSTGGHIHISYRNGAPEGGDNSYQSSELGSSSSSSTNTDINTDINNMVSKDFGKVATIAGQGLKSLGFNVTNENKVKRMSEQINRIKGLM